MSPAPRRALLAASLASWALVAAGCVAVRLPERVDLEELRSRRERVQPGDEIEFLPAQPDGSRVPDRLEVAIMSSSRGPFGVIGYAARTNGPSIHWTIENSGLFWSSGRWPACMSPLTVLTLGIIPQFDSYESVAFYRVRRDNAPASEELWIGVPGTRGRVIGLVAPLFALFEGWELDRAETPDLDRAIADRFLHDLAGFEVAISEGRAPTTDPKTLELLELAKAKRARE